MSFTTSWWDMEATNEPFTWAERETESVMLLLNRNKKHRFPHSVKLESSTNLYDSVPFLDTSLHCCSTWRASIQTYIQTHAKDKGRFNSHIVSTAVIRHQPDHVGQTAFEQAFFTVMTRRNPQWHASFTQSHTNTVLPSIKNSNHIHSDKRIREHLVVPRILCRPWSRATAAVKPEVVLQQ